MIRSFRHKGLQAFFETGSRKGIQPMHAERLRSMLTALNAAADPQDLAGPSWRLHALSGNRQGEHAMTVQANWRLVFCFTADGVELVDDLDDH